MTTYQCPACHSEGTATKPPEWTACRECGCVMSTRYAKKAPTSEDSSVVEEKCDHCWKVTTSDGTVLVCDKCNFESRGHPDHTMTIDKIS